MEIWVGWLDGFVDGFGVGMWVRARVMMRARRWLEVFFFV
jgi:hypothetical protein